MARIQDKEMHEKELNFLKEELKKIDVEIKMNKCTYRDDIRKQLQLWELREKIMEEINKFVDIYFAHHIK
jgi:hypothetical protein